MEYQITKKQCQKQIDSRSEIVCTYCGGKIEPIETVDNAGRPTFWVGCNNCSHFNGGVSPKIYNIAKTMVTEYGLRPYSHIEMVVKEKDPERWQYNLHSQITGAVSIVHDILKLNEKKETH